MKNILIILIIIFFTSCKQKESEENTQNINADTLKTKLVNPEFDNKILSEIKNYYKNEYDNNTRFEEQVTDSTYEIAYYNIPKDTSDYDGFLIAIYIPKNNSNKSIIYGDLNNDNLQDLVVTVSTEGGGSGGNGLRWSDFFVFLNQNDKLILSSVTHDLGLCGSDDGYFDAKKIENGFLVGESYNYDANDARSCPSLHYLTKVILKKNKLVFHSKEKLK